MNLMDLKFKILVWLCPGLLAEVDRLRFFTEATHDIHILQLPYDEYVLEMAFQNAKAMEPDIMTQKATLQDRQTSLLEILKRSQK